MGTTTYLVGEGLRAAFHNVLEPAGRYCGRVYGRRENTGHAPALGGFSCFIKVGVDGEEVEDDEAVTVDGVTRAKPTPYQTMRKCLDAPRYDAVRAMLSDFDGAPFADYTFTPAPE